MDESTDPVIRQFREQISDNDRALVEALNKRLRLVARLKDYKESRGVGFVDPAREEPGETEESDDLHARVVHERVTSPSRRR